MTCRTFDCHSREDCCRHHLSLLNLIKLSVYRIPSINRQQELCPEISYRLHVEQFDTFYIALPNI